ncbi:hypothetical protein [Phormidium sp. CCY1219]|nr:hypothetical protein [Phormidium sp. CCY1219]
MPLWVETRSSNNINFAALGCNNSAVSASTYRGFRTLRSRL